MNSGTMLNAYPDSMGGTLGSIVKILKRPEFADVFRSFYVLPSVFNTDLDRGFSVISYEINRMMADEEDLEQLRGLGMDLKLDFVLNHLSVLSPQFQDVVRNGEASAYRDFFIDWNRFWDGYGEMTPRGYIQPFPEAMKGMFLRKPGLPILMVRLPEGRDVPYWNTFYQEVRYTPVDTQELMQALDVQYGQAEYLTARIRESLKAGIAPMDMDFGSLSAYKENVVNLLESKRRYLGQMDLNLHSPLVWEFYTDTLERLAGYGAVIVRLDAFAYAPKAPMRRNFLNEPETWDLLEQIRVLAAPHGIELLPEIHASYEEGSYRTIAQKGYMTYDFFMPGLIIDAIENHDGTALMRWAEELQESGIRTVNMLGCHDGIPILDLKGMIPEERIQALIDLIVSRGGMIKNLHGQKNVYYQVNATYFSALGEDERKMLLARALQLFMPGKPQIWYLDLFAGKNDLEAVSRCGASGHKEINRTNLTEQEISSALEKDVVKKQLELLRLRNTCPAFGFDSRLEAALPEPHLLVMTWKRGDVRATLEADLLHCRMKVQTVGWEKEGQMII